MKKEDIVTYEIAKRLKDLGFRDLCLYNYDAAGNLVPNSLKGDSEEGITTEDLLLSYNSLPNEQRIDAPILYQVQKWLFKNHKIYVFVGTEHKCKSSELGKYNSLEEALLVGISEALKLLK